MDTRVRRYDDAEKLQLIAEYIHSGESMESFQVKYGMGHCTLSRWIAKFGMSNTFEELFVEMKEKKPASPEKSVREQTLEARIAQLEKELKEEKLKSLAYNAMIDVAEEELGIEIRKKLVPNSR